MDKNIDFDINVGAESLDGVDIDNLEINMETMVQNINNSLNNIDIDNASDNDSEYTDIESEETDSEMELESDDEFDVSRDFVYTVLNNRYIPIKYINRGTFSRVWLTYDSIDNKLVAMKAIFSKYIEDAEYEIEINSAIIDKLSNIDDDNRGLLKMKDYFLNKDEMYLIYDVMGVGIYDLLSYIDEDQDVLLDILVKKATKDILIGLEKLHSINIIHTDLKPENILTNIYPRGVAILKKIFEEENDFGQVLQQLINDRLPDNFNSFNKNKKKKIKRTIKHRRLPDLATRIKNTVENKMNSISDGFFSDKHNFTELNKDLDNKQIDISEDEEFHNDSQTFQDFLKDIDVNDWEDVVNNLTVKIIDFGNCENMDNPTLDEISIRCYRPPENFLNSGFSFSADIWSLGCIIFELYTGDTLFSIEYTDDCAERDRLYITEMIKILGEIPKSLIKNAEFKENLFDDSGNILDADTTVIENTPLINILIEEYELEESIALKLVDFLKKIFNYCPKKRADARDLLNSKWLSDTK